MIDKEIEYVDDIFIRRPDTYNIKLGGYGWRTDGTVVILENGVWIRIPKEEYDTEIHITPTTGTVKVKIKSTGEITRVSKQQYYDYKDLYEIHSSGKVTVYDIETNRTLFIQKQDFDPSKHKPALGGIVSIIDGKARYVTREDFENKNMHGIHKGKVTVLDLADGVKKHVTTEEYHSNKDRYIASGYGKISVFDKNLQKWVKVSKTDFDPEVHNATTHGQRTVWCLSTKQFKNINKDQFDRSLHALASDKHLICTSPDGSVVFDYFGTKKDFVKKYGETVYNIAVQNTQNWQPYQRHKFEKFYGCSFQVKEWR